MEAVVNLKRPINDSELFYRTEFIAHVPSESDHLRSCVECEFHKSSGADSIVLTRRNKHQISYNKCVEYSLLRDIRMHEPVAKRTWSGRHVRM